MHNPPHPGGTLREDVLPALGLTVTEAARQLNLVIDNYRDVSHTFRKILHCAYMEPKPPEIKKARIAASLDFIGVTDGARTHDNRNHNPGLYQLSYSHH